MRWRSASLAASSCALLLAGCGGERSQQPAPQPKLPRALTQQLAVRADRIAERLEANDRCSAAAEAMQLQRDVIRAINSRRVPRRLQEPLQSAANGLVVRIGACAPPPERQREHRNRKKDKHDKKHDRDED
jgi:hypothetical protein